MRISWYADTGMAVFSVWQAGRCTGTFRLSLDDLPRMIETLQRGPAPDSRGGQPVTGERSADELGALDAPYGSAPYGSEPYGSDPLGSGAYGSDPYGSPGAADSEPYGSATPAGTALFPAGAGYPARHGSGASADPGPYELPPGPYDPPPGQYAAPGQYPAPHEYPAPGQHAVREEYPAPPYPADGYRAAGSEAYGDGELPVTGHLDSRFARDPWAPPPADQPGSGVPRRGDQPGDPGYPPAGGSRLGQQPGYPADPGYPPAGGGSPYGAASPEPYRNERPAPDRGHEPWPGEPGYPADPDPVLPSDEFRAPPWLPGPHSPGGQDRRR